MFFLIKKCTENAYFAHSPVTVHFKVSKNVTAFYSMMFNCNFFSRGGASIELFLLCHYPTLIEKMGMLAHGVKRPDISVISVLNEAHLTLKMAKCRPILLHELKLPLFLWGWGNCRGRRALSKPHPCWSRDTIAPSTGYSKISSLNGEQPPSILPFE